MPNSARVQHTDEGVVRVRVWGEKLVVVVPRDRWESGLQLAHTIVREPFTRRTWNEFSFLVLGTPLAGLALGLVAFSMLGGLVLAITFFGLAVVVLSLRIARGFGGFQRGLARGLLHEEIGDPDPFAPRPGFFGWLQTGLRDRTAWRAIAYFLVKVPLSMLGVYVAFSLWWDAFICLVHPIFARGTVDPAEFGFVHDAFRPGYLSLGTNGFIHNLAIFVTGLFLALVAPWAVRGVVAVDKLLMRALLAPDSMVERLRTLEQARTQTVDASAATLRRIERDLHDGTQAQLVALAMRLGMAKEKLETGEQADLAQARELLDMAHRGAKEAIAELRDLARGIHPPALDVGLEGALATLAARNTIPTECTVMLTDRPTPAIESIAYFCVAELLANVAQHASASRATITATQSGQWLRLVVRDDGVGGAQLATLGTSSSGLAGLTDRVHAVDGRLQIASPVGGPTVVTVDLPLHA
jgi:signal transduction histidine kinase